MSAPPLPSTLRLVIGIVLFFAAIAVLPFGFAELASALEGPGYGSTAVRNALIVLGIAGAVLTAGVCLMIWEGAARLRRF